jgi:phage gp29-like protein
MGDLNAKQVQRLAKSVMSNSRSLASRSSDPHFYGGLTSLPNPDPILRAMGQADKVYDAIMSDPHVMGEMRSIKAGLQNFKYRVVSSEEGNAAADEAADLCRSWLKAYEPDEDMSWPDVFWNMGTAVFYGRRVHALEWEYDKKLNALLPSRIFDMPNRRFKYDNDNKLRILTKANNTDGELAEAPVFVTALHMPSHENPYGRAVLSTCYWAYTFKHGGFKFFYEFCESFGMPWPIGRYPMGTQPKEQQELMDALLNLRESGVAVIPEGDAVELLTVNHSGDVIQESLINLCNKEMSKALTSQTQATELYGAGSNAASKTSVERQGNVNEADRTIIESPFNKMLKWITEYNFGPDVPPPKFEFFKQKQATPEEIKVWKDAAEVSTKVPLKAFHDRMGIPMAKDGEEVLVVKTTPGPTAPPINDIDNNTFAYCSDCGHVHEFAADEQEQLEHTQHVIDKSIETAYLQPLADLLLEYEQAGKTLDDVEAAIPKLFIGVDDKEVKLLLSQAMKLAYAEGMEGQQ